jgi:hypothetical protein
MVLGGGQSAEYAGDLSIESGRVKDLTNLSGTFLCDDEQGLRAVAAAIRREGMRIDSGAVRFFPPDGSPPIVLE